MATTFSESASTNLAKNIAKSRSSLQNILLLSSKSKLQSASES